MCRFGTAGEDLPRHLFRSDIGVSEDSDESDHKIGDVSLRFVQSDITIESVIGPDGTTDWDNYASLLNYGLEECMKIDSTEYPLMVSNSDYTNYLKSSENVSFSAIIMGHEELLKPIMLLMISSHLIVAWCVPIAKFEDCNHICFSDSQVLTFSYDYY